MNTSSSVVGGLAPGTRLGRYQTVKRLALGGMAELYLARHQADAGFEKLVALKRVLPHLAEDESFVAMFLNEARLAASLVHPNIAQVTDFGSVGHEYFMVMEFVHGRSVSEILRAASKLDGVPAGAALTIAIGVAGALHHAHEATGPDGQKLGLVHRDVSPSNILVSYDGGVKLVDFGIAKATATAAATRSRTIKGKLAYMSPEQAQGGAIDRRADVFSLGVVLYELTTGRRCFYAEGEFALLNKVADARFDPPTKCVPDYPAELEAIVLRALAKDADDRYATTRDVQRALESYAAARGVATSSVLLSDFVGEVFGAQPYPTTGVLPATQVSGRTDLPATTRVTSRRTWAWVAVGFVGVSVGLGVGLAAAPGDGSVARPADDVASPDPVEPELQAPAAGGADPTAEAEVEAPASAGTDAGSKTQEMPAVVAVEPAAVEPAPSKAGKRSGAKKGRRKGARKGAKKPVKPKVRPPSEFLPPSQRDG